ncbi:type II TA system antitoxin MqsA family protein [Bacillus suaedae]|uniref:DUF4065 domain-containing protein n=1 Tax=Halalkalibacter suaedae TaxID=2822140 RepID=A0A940WUZ8_9BACI|nr:type II TA system antitoxin MqsA family protein [Bacillus suaedae]MBP3952223.1 DUF4065 domain-containing protein [Bacillus suaedae]
MEMHLYCEYCQKDVEKKIYEKVERYHFKGETFQLAANITICSKCGSELADEHVDEQTMKRLTELYMERINLSFAAIKQIRVQLGLSIEVFSKLLGCSEGMITKYESGKSIPTNEHVLLFKKIKSHPETIFDLVEQSKETFSNDEKVIIQSHLRQVQSQQSRPDYLEMIKKNFRPEKTIETGFKEFSLEKITQMILYFAQEGINKTVLLKLLFYADFLHFKHVSVSITGLSYVKYPHGPVPNKFNLLLESLNECGYISMTEESLDEYVRMIIESKNIPELLIFNEVENDILTRVRAHFRGFSSKKISEFSHEEEAWKQPQIHQKISYEYAKYLSIE